MHARSRRPSCALKSQGCRRELDITLRILMIGDVVGRLGRKAIQTMLPGLSREAVAAMILMSDIVGSLRNSSLECHMLIYLRRPMRTRGEH